MSSFFMNNSSINVPNYNEFKNGMLELIAIKKQPSHFFLKHESIYSLPILINGLYTANSGSDEQEIYRFLEQLIPCEHFIETEQEANTHCNSTVNGFLGINFNTTVIGPEKQVSNNETYKNWCFAFLSDHNYFLVKSTIQPSNKKIHLADHHGKKELKDFCDRIKKSPYVLEMHSSDWGGRKFIRKVESNGIIELVLHKTEKQYALTIQTTGKDLLETKAIAELLRDKYDN